MKSSNSKPMGVSDYFQKVQGYHTPQWLNIPAAKRRSKLSMLIKILQQNAEWLRWSGREHCKEVDTTCSKLFVNKPSASIFSK